ncbi:MAG: hypothetical protein NTZ50_02290 [Chloroflexi bacterium]|nr:hypothetical protein [Chloroflexota bacterium]
MERLLGPLLALLLTLGAWLASDLRGRLWNSYVSYSSPYLVSLPAGEAGPPQTRRIVLLVVRGLTEREAEDMPAMQALRIRGAQATLELDTPTFSNPAWLTLLSGASAEIHGGVTDASPPNIHLDTLFERVADSGSAGTLLASASVVARFPSGSHLGDVFDDEDPVQHDAGVVAAMLQILRTQASPERLLVGELAVLDAIRIRGDEAERTMSIAAADIRIESLAHAMDLSRDTLVIVSDRGRAPNGAEGGTEPVIARVPLVLAGAGVQRGAQTLGRAIDFAPTLAVLLGMPIPTHSQGTPLWDLVTSRAFLPAARQLTAFYEAWAEVAGQNRFAAELLRTYEADLAAGVRARYDVWHAALEYAAGQAHSNALATSQSARLPIAIFLSVALLAACYFVLDNQALPPLLGTGIFIAAWVADAVFLRGVSTSLSLFGQSGNTAVLSLLTRDTTLLYLGACIIAAIAAALTCETLGEAVLATIGTLVLTTTICTAIALWFFLRWGDAYQIALPDGTSLTLAQLALRQITALNWSFMVGIPALPIPIVALLPPLFTWNLFGGRVIRD